MNHWLMKSEPDVFGIEHLRAKRVSPWDGVRNYMARNHMLAMRAGDRVLFYHSSADPSGVAGLAEVVREAYPDHTARDPKSEYFDPKATEDNPRWFMVDVKWKSTFPKLIPLEALRRNRKLRRMITLRQGNRLSVTPVTESEWNAIREMAQPVRGPRA